MMVWKIESILHAICLIAVILTDTRKAEKTEDIENSAQRLFFVESERPEKNDHMIDTCRGRCDASKREPICGSDRRVYDNLCQLLETNCRNNVNQTEWETCRGLHYLCPRKCLEIQDPVCGDDNNLYPNLCVMHRRNCGKKMSTQPLKYCFARAREFRSFDPCPDKCLDVYKPVCGSNGIVYLNECYLRKHTCGQNVQMVKISQCVLVRKCPQICIALYDPVCGSDGKMYLNYCMMLKENCGIEIKRMSRKFCDKRERNLTS